MLVAWVSAGAEGPGPSERPSGPTAAADVRVAPDPSVPLPISSTSPPGVAAGGPAPQAAGPVGDAGVMLVRGADDAIYRYDGPRGTLDRVWSASTFEREALEGVYALGRHGGVTLLGWDGATENIPCGSGYASTALIGACASSGIDGVSLRLPAETKARVVLPPDWGAGAVSLSPDARRLLLVRTIEPRPGPGMDPGLSALWLREADGRTREIYRPPLRGVLRAPMWSPDGTKVLVNQTETTSNSFAADGVGVTTILIDLATGAATSLGTTRSETWGPGGQLAFVRGGSRLTWSNKDLIVRDVSGVEKRRTAGDAPQVALAPAWGALGRLAWVNGPATQDASGEGYLDGLGAGRRNAVIEENGVTREVSCVDGRVVEGVRWSQDTSKLLLLCRKPGSDPLPLEIWLYRFADDTRQPLIRGLQSHPQAGGFGFYGAQPSLTSVAAWSLAVMAPASCPPAIQAADPIPAQLLPTNPGPVAARVVRDDSWTRSRVVPSPFVQHFPPRDVAYQQIVCQAAYVFSYGLSEGSKLMRAFDPLPTSFRAAGGDARHPPTLANPTPGLGLQLWLMDVHFLAMSADATGTVTVEVEQRSGFEQVIFDLEAVAASPHAAGSLLFRFVDGRGVDISPPMVRGVGASWEYGRAAAP